MKSCLMLDIGPSWDEETIALLLGSEPNNLRVEILRHDKSARLSFNSREDMLKTISAYKGLVVPSTHGYHYYKFSGYDDGGGAGGEDNGYHNIDDLNPPLHLQLMALPTKELERRLKLLQADGNSTTNHVKSHRTGGNRTCKVYRHASLAYHLGKAMGGGRPIKHCLGRPVPDGSTDTLLEYLRSPAATALWPPQGKQRKGVSAGRYLTVRRQHPREHDTVWNLAEDLIHKVIPGAIYNALAITKDFRGSPHVDNHDKTYQHVIAFGAFEGGYLCTEADEDGKAVLAVDVNCKFGRFDGRAVHWVSGWTGERYSIVYYSSSDDDWTERVPQSVHTQWMESKCNSAVEQDGSSKVPQRKYAPDNPRLPTMAPILGLGCSSFSTFFASDEDSLLTADTISKEHAVVQGWIQTIR